MINHAFRNVFAHDDQVLRDFAMHAIERSIDKAYREGYKVADVDVRLNPAELSYLLLHGYRTANLTNSCCIFLTSSLRRNK